MNATVKSKKIPKYNPKPNRVCVGQYLVGLYGTMNQILKEQECSQEEKNCAAWAMNMTMLEITSQWCKCPWCKATGAKIEELLKKPHQKQKETDEKE